MQRSRPLGQGAAVCQGSDPRLFATTRPLGLPRRAPETPCAMSSRCGHLTRANSRDRERSEMIITLNPFPYSVSNSRDVGGCGRLAFDRGLRGAVRRSRRVRGLSLVALAVAGQMPDLWRGDRKDGFAWFAPFVLSKGSVIRRGTALPGCSFRASAMATPSGLSRLLTG
jgi:hypothetical protein